MPAVFPDRNDAIDVGLGAGPDPESRVVRVEVHRQRRAQIAEARMHFAGNRPAMRANDRIDGEHARLRATSLRYSAMASVSQIGASP